MMFKQFEQLLQVHEQVDFQIKKTQDNQLEVIIVPKLSTLENPEKLNETIASIRSALSMPLHIKATSDELDTNLIEQLSTYSTNHIELTDTLSVLEKVKQQASKAVVKAEKKVTKETTSSNTTKKIISDNKEVTETPQKINSEKTENINKTVSQSNSETTSLF